MLIMLVMMLVMVVLVLALKLLYRIFNSVLGFHCREYIRSRKLFDRSGDYNRVRVMLSHKLNGFLYLEFLSRVRMRKNDRRSIFNLVIKELTEILHIHFAFARVYNGSEAIKNSLVRGDLAYRADNVGKLADARGLDDYSVGTVLGKNLAESLCEITDQRATNATRIHFGYFNSGILQKSAVYTNFTKFVFYKNNLLASVCFFQKLFDESSFTSAEKAGKYINLCHLKRLLALFTLNSIILFK